MSKYRAYEQPLGRMDKQIVLESDCCQIMINPAAGFNLYSAIYKNRQMLMPTNNITNPGAGAGVPILFPTPNRTRECKYSFGGHDCFLQKNGEARYLHGLMLDERFNYECGADENGAWAKGWASIIPAMGCFASYPFPCTLTILYTLNADGLRLTYTVKNDGEETLPYGFAIHPYFNKFGQPDKVTIQVPADGYYEAEECLPSGKILPAEGDAFDIVSRERPVSELRLDHVYHNVGTACIRYKELGITLELSASEEFKNMVVFTPPMLGGFCLENQTNATDYLNLYAKGIDTACMNTVEPGQSKTGYIHARIV